MDSTGHMTYEEALQHYGVKGMKWGVTRSRPSGVAINKARDRVATEKNRVARADAKAENIKDPKERAKAQKEVAKQRMEFLQNPDRVTAQYITKGDVFSAGLLGFTLGSGAGVAAPIAARVVARKGIEAQQARRAQESSGSSRKLAPKGKVSSVTKKAIEDHNNMNDVEFKRKYAVSKATYAKRVDKYGDPYMNSPAAKLGKKLGSKS